MNEIDEAHTFYPKVFAQRPAGHESCGPISHGTRRINFKTTSTFLPPDTLYGCWTKWREDSGFLPRDKEFRIRASRRSKTTLILRAGGTIGLCARQQAFDHQM